MSNIVVLTTEMNQTQMARAVPGAYYDRERRAYVLDASATTPRAAAVALKLFPEVSLTAPELVTEREKLIQDVRPFDNATPYDHPVVAEYVRAVLADQNKALYNFQELDLGYLAAVLAQYGGAYLGWERGLGKTIGSIALVEETDARRVLVVAPNTAKDSVWFPDLHMFFADRFDQIEVLPNAKARRNRVLGWQQDWQDRGESYILIANYEQLRILGTTAREWEKYGQWDIVIADEAHRIKNAQAKQSKAIKKINTRHKLALSGSIISNHAEELFSPLQWLFPDRYRSKWRDWNDRYIDYVEGGFSKIPVGIKTEKLDELREELGVFMVYRRKEDELDLPDRTEQTLPVELSPAQRKAYDELQATCLTELEDGTKIAATDGLVMLGKLRQIATGLSSFTDDELADSTKIDLALELIRDNEDEAFVVFSWYKAAARAMYDRLEQADVEAFIVDGDTKKDVRAEQIQRFQAGEKRVFVGTIATMGESVNLFRANNAVFLDRSWNPGDNLQAADRIYRIGQDKPVTITHIVAKDTVDESRVQPSLASKEALRAMILGGTK